MKKTKNPKEFPTVLKIETTVFNDVLSPLQQVWKLRRGIPIES